MPTKNSGRTHRPAPSAPSRRSAPKKRRKTAAPAYTDRRTLESKLLRQNARVKTKNNIRRPKRPTQPMVYTQPKVFNRNRFLLQLLITAAVVLALVLGMSIFFRVEHVLVDGAKAYDPNVIKQASGIREGDNLFSLQDARAAGRIRAELPYVNRVRVGIKLPNTVIIYIEELEIAYAAKCNSGTWWLITSEGRVVEQIDAVKAAGYTQIKGIILMDPQINSQAVALEAAPAATEDQPLVDQSTPVTVTNAQRLAAALEILQALEDNDIVGEAASIDVSNLNALELWYGRQYQVVLGDNQELAAKIHSMKRTISQLGDYEMGVLDVSFTTWKDMAGYTPFAD